MSDLSHNNTRGGPLQRIRGVLDGAKMPGADLTLSRPQRGLLPTMEFWNQRGAEFRHVRRAFVLLILGLGIAGSGISSQLVAGTLTMASVGLYFLGLGLYERKIRRELAARRGGAGELPAAE